MASSDSSFLSLLQEEVNCAFCLDQLKTPRTLTCMHGFCEKCLESYEDQNPTPGKIACPVCQEETVLQDSGIAGLRRDFRAVNLIEKLGIEKGKQQQQMKAPTCDICGGIDPEGPSSYVNCLDCEQVMCKQCRNMHQKMKSCRSHILTAFCPIPKPVMGHGNEDQDNADDVGLCEKHNGRKMVLFCSTCLIPVCQECSDDDHRFKDNHECIPVEQYAPVMREDLLTRLSKVPQLSAGYTEVLYTADKTEEYMKNFSDRMQAAFTRHTDIWRADCIHKKEKFFNPPMQTVGQVRLEAEGHLVDLKRIQIRAEEVLLKGKQCRLASGFKDIRDSLDTFLRETSGRNIVETISKTMHQLQFDVNDDTRFWSACRERRNISVDKWPLLYALAFTRDGRLAVSVSMEKSYGATDPFIQQTSATYRLAKTFGMAIKLGYTVRALSSLSDLRFAIIHGDSLSLLNETSSCIVQPEGKISDIAVDLEDKIYYSHSDSKQIRTINLHGTKMKPISTGDLTPSRIALCPPSSPDLIIFTHDSSKVSVIDLNGKLLRTITRPDWTDVAIGCDNREILYVLWRSATDRRTLQRFTTEGHLLDTLFETEIHSFPDPLLAVSPGGSAAVVTDKGNVTVISTRRKVDLANYNA